MRDMQGAAPPLMTQEAMAMEIIFLVVLAGLVILLFDKAVQR